MAWWRNTKRSVLIIYGIREIKTLNNMATFLFVVISLTVLGFSILGWWYNSPAYKGKEGENRVHNKLLQLSDDYVLLDNVVLRTDRGTTQIDHVVVSRYGVFAIETRTIEATCSN